MLYGLGFRVGFEGFDWAGVSSYIVRQRCGLSYDAQHPHKPKALGFRYSMS